VRSATASEQYSNLLFFYRYYIVGPFVQPFFRRNVTSSSSGSSESPVNNNINNVVTSSVAAAGFKGSKNSRWRRFVVKPLFFVQFFLGIGLLAMALKQFRRKNKHPEQSPELIAKDWEV